MIVVLTHFFILLSMPTKATWQKLQILKSKMADGRHFKIVKSPYFSEKSSDFNQGRINHGAKRAMAQGPPAVRGPPRHKIFFKAI